MTTPPIRLACTYCDRPIIYVTPEELAALEAEGWTEIIAMRWLFETFDLTADYTHLGICPDCRGKQ